VGMAGGEPMVDRKTRVRRSMSDHWVDTFYRKMQELKRVKIEFHGFRHFRSTARPGGKVMRHHHTVTSLNAVHILESVPCCDTDNRLPVQQIDGLPCPCKRNSPAWLNKDAV